MMPAMTKTEPPTPRESAILAECLELIRGSHHAGQLALIGMQALDVLTDDEARVLREFLTILRLSNWEHEIILRKR